MSTHRYFESGAQSPLNLIELYALSSMLRHCNAAAAAMGFGLGLFPHPSARAVAALVLTGSTRPIERLDPHQRRLADELGGAVLRCSVPGDDSDWAKHLVNILSQSRLVPIVADTLRWAADALERGQPICTIAGSIVTAAQLLVGEHPSTAAALLAESGGGV